MFQSTPSVTALAPAGCPHPFLLFKLRFPIPGLVCGSQEFICLFSRAVIIVISLTYVPLSNVWKLDSGARNMAHKSDTRKLRPFDFLRHFFILVQCENLLKKMQPCESVGVHHKCHLHFASH